MNNIKEKISTSSKTMALITKILLIINSITLLIPVIFIIIFSVNPNADISMIEGLKMWSSAGTIIKTSGAAIAEMCSIIVSQILLLLMFLNAYRMFKAITVQGTPFTEYVISSLKKNGILMIVYFFVTPIARYSFYISLAKDSYSMSSFNIVYIVIALIFIFMSKIFSYGAELQQQSDETL